MRRAKRLRYFVEHHLADYEKARQQAADQRDQPAFALSALRAHQPADASRSRRSGRWMRARYRRRRTTRYINELIGWRELAVNFVTYARERTTRSSARSRGRRRRCANTCATGARTTTHTSNWSAARRMMSFGTRRRCKWCATDGCTTTAHVLGEENSGVVAEPGPGL